VVTYDIILLYILYCIDLLVIVQYVVMWNDYRMCHRKGWTITPSRNNLLPFGYITIIIILIYNLSTSVHITLQTTMSILFYVYIYILKTTFLYGLLIFNNKYIILFQNIYKTVYDFKIIIIIYV